MDACHFGLEAPEEGKRKSMYDSFAKRVVSCWIGRAIWMDVLPPPLVGEVGCV
jgi:hypothetical protein